MLRPFVILSLVFALVFAASNSGEILKRADALYQSGTKTEVFRAYNDYKNLYLQSVMNNDPHLRREALKGIVKSGEKLRIDVAKYSRELASLKSESTSVNNQAAKDTSSKSESGKKPRVTRMHRMKNVRWIDGRLILEFDKRLKSEQVNYFKLYDKKKKRYRYVFDLEASMLDRSQDIRHKEVKRIRLAQFKPHILRLVVENDVELNVRFKIDEEMLVVNLGVSGVQAPEAIKPVRPKDKVVILDPGHGGKDGGAVGYKKYVEKKIVLEISQKLRNVLKKQGYKVYMTRSGDKFIKLQKRTAYANAKKGDLFISIHANAVPKKNAKKAKGIETYFLSNDVDAGSERAKRVARMENSKDLADVNYYGQTNFINILNREKIKKSERLAHDLQRNVLAKLTKDYKGVKDGGVREGPFWILVGAQMPAVLVEVGFISHPQEAKLLANSRYQQLFAEGMAEGINRYFANNP